MISIYELLWHSAAFSFGIIFTMFFNLMVNDLAERKAKKLLKDREELERLIEG